MSPLVSRAGQRETPGFESGTALQFCGLPTMPPPRYGKASKASKKEEKKPSGPSQAELLAKAREAQIAERDRVRKEREAAAQQRREAARTRSPARAAARVSAT
ncbi:hypothetical protein SO694_00131031 [Aureococcus anophagefferens]|uniref:Casein kinase substrate phosphoprotein PP28 domain-containing protein n=1 Tax=Aureococcus anophagefferens TaxID=44056 RepID=A0ABR1GG19_AURAN